MNIRGIRHLWRMSDFSLKKILVRCGDQGFDICEVIKTKPNSQIGERMFIFNSAYNHSRCDFTLLSSIPEMRKLLNGISHSRILEVTNNDGFRNYIGLLDNITLLPDSFDQDYEAFLKENSKMVKRLCDKYGLNPHDMQLKRLYIYTEGSKNFFQWAVDLYFRTGCSMHTIMNILLWNENYGQLAKKLARNTITAYVTQSGVNELMDELTSLRNDKRINDAINSFNTTQKKLLKTNELSKNEKNTLARFAKLSDAKRINFIKKVSSINDYQELMRQLRHVTSAHFDWNKESFMDFMTNVEGIECEIIYENDMVVLVKVADYETIKQLAKTTNWCISKNKTYWNNYIERNQGNATQYMIFDFSKLEDDKFSIIGFTTTYNKGITSAHNFTNDNLMNTENAMNTLLIKSYIARFNGNDSIYKILQNCGIDITLVAHYDKPQYKWNYEDFMNYLYECVDKNNVDVINYENNKLTLSIHDENIKYFFGDSYIDNIPSDCYGEQHIIFADFTMSQYDPNKLIFGVVSSHQDSEEDYCNTLFNEFSRHVGVDFDSKLIEFNVPYDIIRRTDDITKKVKNAFVNFNVNMLKNCIKENSNCLHTVMDNILDDETILHIIYQSTVELLSFDYLNLIYCNGHYLSDYLDASQIGEILRGLLNTIRIANRQWCQNEVMEKPNDEQIEAFYNETLNNRNEAMYVGSYLIIKYIITHENRKGTDFNRLYSKILSNIHNTRLTSSLTKEPIYLMLANLDMSEKSDSSSYIVAHFTRFGDEEMQNTIKGLAEKYKWVAQAYESAMKYKMEQDVVYNTFSTYAVADAVAEAVAGAPF